MDVIEVFMAAVGALAVVFAALVWLGFRNGDHDDDARLGIAAFTTRGPDGPQFWVRITITNPAPSPILVSCRYEVVAGRGRAASRTTTMMPRGVPTVTTFALLGAVDSRDSHAFDVPLATSSPSTVFRIEVRLDESDHRTRVQTRDLALAGPVS